MKEYLRRMQYSGYCKEVRAQVVESAMKTFGVTLEKDASGMELMYMLRGWNRVARAKKLRSGTKQLKVHSG